MQNLVVKLVIVIFNHLTSYGMLMCVRWLHIKIIGLIFVNQSE